MTPEAAIDAVTLVLDERDDGRIQATSNRALAKYIIQTICEHDWYVATDTFQMSNPLKHPRICIVCGKTDSVRAETSRTKPQECHCSEGSSCSSPNCRGPQG